MGVLYFTKNYDEDKRTKTHSELYNTFISLVISSVVVFGILISVEINYKIYFYVASLKQEESKAKAQLSKK